MAGNLPAQLAGRAAHGGPLGVGEEEVPLVRQQVGGGERGSRISTGKHNCCLYAADTMGGIMGRGSRLGVCWGYPVYETSCIF